MEYFECDVPAGDAVCSDNSCPCGLPGVKIPRGTGYLYISQSIVDFRSKYPTKESARRAAQLRQEQISASFNKIHAVVATFRIVPTLVCEQGAKLRNLDLEIAAADAKYWWETGRVPLRATPTIKTESRKFTGKSVRAINAVNTLRQEQVQSELPYASHLKIQKLLTPEARKRRRIAFLVGLIGVPALLILLAVFIPKISERRAFNTFLLQAQEQVELYRPRLVQMCTEIYPNASPKVPQILFKTLLAMERKPVVGTVFLYMPYVGDDYMIWEYVRYYSKKGVSGEFKGAVVSKSVEKAALSALEGDPSLIDAFNNQTIYSWNEVLYDSQKRAVAVIRLQRWGFVDSYLNELEERMVNLPSQIR